MEPVQFLDGLSGYVRKSTDGAADRAIRLAVIDPGYAFFGPGYPNYVPSARVTFEGETTLSGKSYAVASGFCPIAGNRVWMVPIGNSWLIAGAAAPQSTQGFYGEPTSVGVEFGDGSFYDSVLGMYLETDLEVAGDMSVSGIGKTMDIIKPSNTSRTTATVSADPHLTMNLDVGSWWVEFHLMIGATTGDIKTQWQVTGTTTGPTLRIAWGPSPFSVDTTTEDELQGRDAVPMRVGVHQLTTEIAYGMNHASNLTSVWERASFTLTTPGNITLHWAQAAASAGTPSVISAGSVMQARRIG